ncbi:unnamed protein product [Closterium sp. NIES-64]|nr:unnamed protein product [Closterium sp. NIES-64]
MLAIPASVSLSSRPSPAPPLPPVPSSPLPPPPSLPLPADFLAAVLKSPDAPVGAPQLRSQPSYIQQYAYFPRPLNLQPGAVQKAEQRAEQKAVQKAEQIFRGLQTSGQQRAWAWAMLLKRQYLEWPQPMGESAASACDRAFYAADVAATVRRLTFLPTVTKNLPPFLF